MQSSPSRLSRSPSLASDVARQSTPSRKCSFLFLRLHHNFRTPSSRSRITVPGLEGLGIQIAAPPLVDSPDPLPEGPSSSLVIELQVAMPLLPHWLAAGRDAARP
jgi:hypothetical protein